eukprot:3297562-Pyramimonas_sp.AAC.1
MTGSVGTSAQNRRRSAARLRSSKAPTARANSVSTRGVWGDGGGGLAPAPPPEERSDQCEADRPISATHGQQVTARW